MSFAGSSPAVTERTRIATLLLAGVATAYSIYLFHKNYTSSTSSAQSGTRLQRHGAVRHQQRSRPRRRATSAPEARARVEDAIQRLQAREDAGEIYASVELFSDATPRAVVFDALPSRLPSPAQIEEQYNVNPEEAHDMRRRAEHIFVERFLRESFNGRTISQLEEHYLRIELMHRGISYAATSAGVNVLNDDQRPVSRADQSTQARTPRTDRPDDWLSAEEILELEERETQADEESDDGWQEGNDSRGENTQAQGLQNLVYNIAKDQAIREGYVHRGVSCNSCGAIPIRGIRYRCANCNDFDLCEDCEAQQVHIKTHLFFKVRIPAPFLGNGRPAIPVWYPGKPHQFTRNIPKSLAARLREETDLESHDIDALWDQFSCLAATEWAEDPNHLGMAIDRKTFDKCFVPATSMKPPPPNLLYDRMFAYYDTNHDSLIGFEEFVTGLAAMMNGTRDEKLKRIFIGYDLDNDGFVSRKDFLRMFRAWFVVQKELTRDATAGFEEEFLQDGGVREIVMSSQPISSAFSAPIPNGNASRVGAGKVMENGDLVIVDGGGTLRSDSDPTGDRFEHVAEAARPRLDPLDRHLAAIGVTIAHGAVETFPPSEQEIQTVSEWVPENLTNADVVEALGEDIPTDDIMDAVDRARVAHAIENRLVEQEEKDIEHERQSAVNDRWKRRRFYTDEEEGSSAPPGYQEADSSDEDEDADELEDHASSISDSRIPSPRSRSSSKVRFEDSVTDTDYETRSNTSSRSIPVGERWGGYELTEPEKDVGKDILYLSVQQGFNEMLDALFKDKEDFAMEAKRSRREREPWKKEISDWATRQSELQETKAARPGKLVTDPELANTATEDLKPTDKPLDDLLTETGYSVVANAPFTNGSRQLDIPADQDNTADSPLEPPNAPGVHTPYDNTIDIPHPRVGHSDLSAARIPTSNPEGDTRDSGANSRSRIYPTSSLQQVVSANSSVVRDDATITYQDPTLPQFRPDSAGPETSATDADDEQPPFNSAAAAQLASMPPLEPYPSEDQLRIWATHQACDREIEERGGKEGTLSYEEFLRKMVGEKGVLPYGQPNSNMTKREDLEELIKAGKLGRLAFVGSWIDMASF